MHEMHSKRDITWLYVLDVHSFSMYPGWSFLRWSFSNDLSFSFGLQNFVFLSHGLNQLLREHRPCGCEHHNSLAELSEALYLCCDRLTMWCVGGSDAGIQRPDTILLWGSYLQQEGIERREWGWYLYTILSTKGFSRYPAASSNAFRAYWFKANSLFTLNPLELLCIWKSKLHKRIVKI